MEPLQGLISSRLCFSVDILYIELDYVCERESSGQSDKTFYENINDTYSKNKLASQATSGISQSSTWTSLFMKEKNDA